jgi:hypothetical protein
MCALSRRMTRLALESLRAPPNAWLPKPESRAHQRLRIRYRVLPQRRSTAWSEPTTSLWVSCRATMCSQKRWARAG